MHQHTATRPRPDHDAVRIKPGSGSVDKLCQESRAVSKLDSGIGHAENRGKTRLKRTSQRAFWALPKHERLRHSIMRRAHLATRSPATTPLRLTTWLATPAANETATPICCTITTTGMIHSKEIMRSTHERLSPGSIRFAAAGAIRYRMRGKGQRSRSSDRSPCVGQQSCRCHPRHHATQEQEVHRAAGPPTNYELPLGPHCHAERWSLNSAQENKLLAVSSSGA